MSATPVREFAEGLAKPGCPRKEFEVEMRLPERLPLVMTPMVRAWACKKRGLCCKYQHVQIDEVERRRLERLLGEVDDPLRHRVKSENIQTIEGWPVLPRVDRICAFLGPENLCTIRTRFGEQAYPAVCKKFPYLSIVTSDQQLVGLSFQCPSALELLANEARFEVVQDDGESPVERVAFVNSPERSYVSVSGEPITAEAFWDHHKEHVQRFLARTEADPALRLVAFAEDLTGELAPPPVMVRRDIWLQGAFEPSVERELSRIAGPIPPGLPWLWIQIDPQEYTLSGVPDFDSKAEKALLLRYLMHRLVMPVAYISLCDPRFMLSTLFAMLARYRIERARGYGPLQSIRQLDRFFVHTSNPGALFGTGSTFISWRAMASLARAVTVG